MSSVAAGKLAIVTGANKGIGYEIAKGLAANGCTTILACRNAQLGEAAAREMQSEGLDVSFRLLDVGDRASIAAFAECVKNDLGGKIDVLVNNAAIAFKGSDPTPFARQAAPTLAVNFFGTVALTNALLPFLQMSPAPRVVNVASESGHLSILKSKEKVKIFTAPDLSEERLVELMLTFQTDVEAGTHATSGWPSSCYGMSKLGLIAYTKILAREQPSMLVHACCPGYVQTDMSSHQGNKRPDEGAQTPIMLALHDEEDELRPSGQFWSSEHVIDW